MEQYEKPLFQQFLFNSKNRKFITLTKLHCCFLEYNWKTKVTAPLLLSDLLEESDKSRNMGFHNFLISCQSLWYEAFFKKFKMNVACYLE